MQRKTGYLATLAILSLVCSAEAQITIDVSKITCDQYLTQRVTHSRTINIWLQGFSSGQRNEPVVDVQAFEKSSRALARYCETHRGSTLFEAIDAAIPK